MLRNITAGVAGIVAGVVLISLVQWISHVIVPLPPGFDAADPEALARLVAQLPPLAFILLELSYVAGALASGFVAARLARTRPMALALVMGGVFTLFNIANQLQIPHPAWLAVLTTVTFLPLAWLGGRLALGFRPSARG